MAFFGKEITPDTPYVLGAKDVRGRLRLSKATLGDIKAEESEQKSVLKCQIGEEDDSKGPINLCSLFPTRKENSTLNLEFEEIEQVSFTVAGPHSICVSGYYFDNPAESVKQKEDKPINKVVAGDVELINMDDEEPLNKPQSEKKRKHESAIEPHTAGKKAKMSTLRKTVHVATPHPPKNPHANKSNQRSPASAADSTLSCCDRFFKTQHELDSHRKARHMSKRGRKALLREEASKRKGSKEAS